jgi:hypothetical protein
VYVLRIRAIGEPPLAQRIHHFPAVHHSWGSPPRPRKQRIRRWQRIKRRCPKWAAIKPSNLRFQTSASVSSTRSPAKCGSFRQWVAIRISGCPWLKDRSERFSRRRDELLRPGKTLSASAGGRGSPADCSEPKPESMRGRSRDAQLPTSSLSRSSPTPPILHFCRPEEGVRCVFNRGDARL